MDIGEQFEKGDATEDTYIAQSRAIEDYMERWSHKTEGDAIPHPTNQFGVLRAFEIYSLGNVSDREVAHFLNEEGYRTTGNWGVRPFENDTVRPMLQNRFYLGETQYKGEWFPGRHEALVSEELFQKCQEVRARRRSRTPRQKSQKRIYPLSRLALCAQCEQPLRGQPNWQNRRYYRAPKRADKSCSGKMIPAEAVEQTVLDYLSQIKLPSDWRERVLAISQARRGETESYETKKHRLENRMERLKTLFKLGDIEKDEYVAERADIHNKLEALKPAQVPEMEAAAAALEEIGDLLKTASLRDLDTLFHSMLTTVYLHHDYPGYVVGIEPKPFLKNLMNISMLPTWSPPHTDNSASEGEDDDPAPDPDGNGGGQNGHKNDGQLVPTGNHGIMTTVDAGENNRVAVTNGNPVAPALGVCQIKVVHTHFYFLIQPFQHIIWCHRRIIQNNTKVSMQRNTNHVVIIHKYTINDFGDKLLPCCQYISHILTFLPVMVEIQLGQSHMESSGTKNAKKIIIVPACHLAFSSDTDFDRGIPLKQI